MNLLYGPIEASLVDMAIPVADDLLRVRRDVVAEMTRKAFIVLRNSGHSILQTSDPTSAQKQSPMRQATVHAKAFSFMLPLSIGASRFSHCDDRGRQTLALSRP